MSLWEPSGINGEFALPADISPTQLAANTNDWAPTGLAGATVIRFSTDALRNLTGITGGYDGRILFLANIGSFPLTLKHDVTSTAANRFFCPGQLDDSVLAGSTKQLIYDSTSSRWRVIASTNPVTVALTADATANATTTAAKITGLDLTLVPGTYMFDYWIRYISSVATTGAKFDVNFSTGTVTMFMFNMYFGGVVAADATAGHSQAQNLTTAAPMRVLTSRAIGSAGKSPTISTDTTGDMMMRIEGMMIVTVAGNIELWHGSETANSTTVKAGSSLILTKTA